MDRLPFHVLIIPDGNRRWAKKQKLALYLGHHEGYEALKNILPHIWEYGVTHLTFWALSFENLKRGEEEISVLRELLKKWILGLKESPESKDRKIVFHAAGEIWEKHFSGELSCLIDGLKTDTKSNKGPVFTLLLAYDGRKECMAVIERVRREIPWPRSFVEDDVGKRLWTAHLPDVDIVIRTGEEMDRWTHLSGNVLFWQMRNPEIYSTPTLWPNFTIEEFKKVVGEFKLRPRRHGA